MGVTTRNYMHCNRMHSFKVFLSVCYLCELLCLGKIYRSFDFCTNYTFVILFWCLNRLNRPHRVIFKLIICHWQASPARDMYGVNLSSKTHNLNQFICTVFPVCVFQTRDVGFVLFPGLQTKTQHS